MAHFSYHDLSTALDLVKETGIFVPLGLLITFLVFSYRPAFSRLKGFVLSGTGCFIFALLIELSQAVCLGRYVDVTDAILAGFGGISGSALFSLFSTNIGKIE
jgi:glycopeptide antibiotics resistance protein